MLKRKLIAVALVLCMMLTCTICIAESASAIETTYADDELYQLLVDGEWDTIVECASGSSMVMSMWGDSPAWINMYDELAALMLERYDITVTYTTQSGGDYLEAIRADKQLGVTEGDYDFTMPSTPYAAAMVEEGSLWGGTDGAGIVEYLPNAMYLDFENNSDYIYYDCGAAVNGCVVPWTLCYYGLTYNSEKVEDVPTDFFELFEWAKENPGKFAYCTPPTWWGSRDVRMIAAYLSAATDDDHDLGLTGTQNWIDAYHDNNETVDDDQLNEWMTAAYDYLTELSPYLWAGGDTYPSSYSQIKQIFSDGEIYMYFDGVGRAASDISDGTLPDTTETAAMKGVIYLCQYVGIPFNAGNKAAALLLSNLVLDPEVQLKMLNTTGSLPAIDSDLITDPDLKETYLTGLDAWYTGSSVMSNPEKLNEYAVSDVPADYATHTDIWWIDNISPEAGGTDMVVIAAAVLVLLSAIVALLYFFWYRKKKQI